MREYKRRKMEDGRRGYEVAIERGGNTSRDRRTLKTYH